MPRTVKEDEHASKRNDILEATQRLLYVKGYEQMSIQDLLNELKISKGAFYHYYASKSELLEAVVEHMFVQVLPVAVSIVEDPALAALPKLQRYFETMGQWKVSKKGALLQVLRSWYSDENLVLRHKMNQRMMQYAGEWFAAIVRQGIAEGVFKTTYGDQIGRMSTALIASLGDVMAGWLLAPNQGRGKVAEAQMAVDALNDALERLLGAPPGSIATMTPDMIIAWFGDDPEPMAIT